MTEWREVGYLLQSSRGPRERWRWEYRLTVPEPLASWDGWDYWERERTHSMSSELEIGDVLYDLGAEVGWQSAVYAQIVGGENMVLVEPSAEFWPNIRQTWTANGALGPAGCFVGLVGDHRRGAGTVYRGWPPESEGPLTEDRAAYRYIHDPEVPMLTLDWIASTDRLPPPRALTVDCEGAEMRILRGAETVLTDDRPLMWISVHPDLMERHHGDTVGDLYQLLNDFEYGVEVLAVDHETHLLCEPK